MHRGGKWKGSSRKSGAASGREHFWLRAAPQPGVSGRLILRAVLDRHPALPVTYLPRRADLVEHVPRLTRPGDVVLTLGAGDLTTLPDEWLQPVEGS